MTTNAAERRVRATYQDVLDVPAHLADLLEKCSLYAAKGTGC